MSGDEMVVPVDRGCRLRDQEHLSQTPPIERARGHGEDGAVGVGESGSVHLALQHQNLVTKGEDLGVALIAGREQP